MNGIFLLPVFCFLGIWLLESFYPHSRRAGSRLAHAAINLSVGGIDGLINAVSLMTVTASVAQWGSAYSVGLLQAYYLPPAVEWLVAMAACDLWMYLWHRANHRLPLLWRLHRAHHNDIAMDATTAVRFHPLEIIVSSGALLVVVTVLGVRFDELLAYNMILQCFVLFHHSNIALAERWDRRLRLAIVTPQMHRVHHSVLTEETNSNYSSILSLWDRSAGTFRMREDTRGITCGLPVYRGQRWQGVGGIIRIPFEAD